MRALALAIVCAVATAAHAQPAPAPTPSTILRDGNAAAAAGDWARVVELVAPLLTWPTQLPTTELAETYRLSGIAAFFQQRPADAEHLFLAYLRLDLDGQLDPSLYPPEVVSFFANVRETHKEELRALRPKPRGSIWLSLLPPVGQFQNGERTKGIVIGALLATTAVANIGSYALLSSWCTRVTGPMGSSLTCDHHTSGAATLRTVDIASGIALIATYAYGVYDGVSHYRRRMRELSWTPYATSTSVGIVGSF